MRFLGTSSSGSCRRKVSAILLCNIVMMSRTSHGVFRFAASAWMPRYADRQPQMNRGVLLSLLVRGGSDYSNNYCPICNSPSASSISFPTVTTRSFGVTTTSLRSAPSSAEEEATAYAASLCGDDLSCRAASDFGGLKYFNTDIDTRFHVLFVLGGPGAGKGTQSALMVEHYPVVHFSVGELLRNVPAHSPHKATIDASLVAGQIVPVDISLALLKAAMEEAANRHALFLVDGFPRNYDNLSGWSRVMHDVAALEAVLVYQCPLPVLQERILQRAKDSGRADDNLESVKKRFRTFEGETVPVVEILRTASQNCPAAQQRWSVVDIAGDRPVEDVWQSTQQVLNQLILHDVLTANAALLAAVQTGNVRAYEALCDPNFFTGSRGDVAKVMRQQEGLLLGGVASNVQRAQVDVISGKNVAVSYDRLLDGVLVREKRFWSHQGVAGWRNVHFARTPVVAPTTP